MKKALIVILTACLLSSCGMLGIKPNIRVEMNFETLLSDASYADWLDDGHFSPSPDYPLGPGRFFVRVVDDVPFGAKLSISE